MSLHTDSPMEDCSTPVAQDFIRFRNQVTKEIIAEVEIPSFVILKNEKVNDLQQLSSGLRMLYLDVLNRGYCPLKSKEGLARTIFKTDKQIREGKNKGMQLVSVNKLTNTEAVSTIWRCLGRETGHPIKSYSMAAVQKQLQAQMSKMRKGLSIKQSILKSSSDPCVQIYRRTANQAAELQREVQCCLHKMADTSGKGKQRFNWGLDRVALLKILEQQIINLESSIFEEVVVGIRQCDHNTDLVELVLEQSYPYIKMSRNKAIEMLGQELFASKWDRYHSEHGDEADSQDTITIVCHRCLSYLNQQTEVQQCNDAFASSVLSHTILTDPYIYSSTILNETGTKISEKFMHPYLSYFCLPNSESTFVCNRFICSRCILDDPSIKKTGNCSFCEGTCQCRRCQGMDILTKIMAIYIEQQGDLSQVTSMFKMKFDSRSLSIQNKKDLKINADIYEDFFDYLQCCIESDIFIKQQNMESFTRIQYYPSDIAKEDEEQYQKFVTKKWSQKKQESQEQNKSKMRVKNKNRETNSQRRNQQSQNFEEASERLSTEKEVIREEIDCYYQDSS